MAVGDILFYHSDDIGGRLIDWRTHGPYSHVCIEVEDSKVIEAKWPDVSLDVRGHPAAEFTPKLDAKMLPDAVAWLHTTVGDHYDLWNIVACGFGVVVPNKKVFKVPTAFICSELTAWFLVKAGFEFPPGYGKDDASLDVVTPNDVARMVGILHT